MASVVAEEPFPKERPDQIFEDHRLLIDGSVLEGGGQILRNAAAYSCILGISIKVVNIRAGRDKPGLKPQHVTSLELVSRVCGGGLVGCAPGSSEVTLDPGQITCGNFVGDTKTAGSICLLMQATIPCLLFAPVKSTLHLKGGTNCDFAPQIDYTTMIFRPIAEKFGMHFDVDIRRRGYFPKGGGEVFITVHPSEGLTGVDGALTERGDLVRIYSRSFVAGSLPEHLSRKVSHAIAKDMKHNFPGVSLQQDSVKEPDRAAIGSGLGTIIVAETSKGCLLGGSALGKPRSQAEDTGSAAAKELIAAAHAGGCVDEHLQDQLILPMALAKGRTRMLCGRELTLHTRTAIHISQLMTKAEFTYERVGDNLIMLICDGIGHVNPNLSGAHSS